jgi:hypothetical protein
VAAGDTKPPEESDEESPAPKKHDVRVSSHEDMGVHVSRDLRATGPTARGYGSNMSKLNFSSRGMPHEEIAEDEAPAPAKPAKPAAAAPVQPPAPADSPSSPAGPESEGVLTWLTGLFTRR